MNRAISIFTFAMILAAGASGGDFEIKSAAPLSVTYRGTPLITGETAIPEFTAKADVRRVDVPGWEAVYQVRRAGDAQKVREEVAASKDAFEFTLVRLVEADAHGFVRYGFVAPHEFLDGRRAEIVGAGEKVPAKYVQKTRLDGPIGAEGISHVKSLLYLRMHRPEGAIDFDFNPRGWWTGEKTVTPHAAEWSMRREKEGYVFSTAFSRTIWGTLQEFKFIIRAADERPVAEVHPRVANRWTTPYPNLLNLNIGTLPVEGYTPVPSDKARWRDAASVRLETDERFKEAGQMRYEGASPTDPKTGATLEINVGRSGHCLVNMLVGSPDREVGPCEVSDGAGRKASCPPAPKGSFDSWAIVAFAKDGKIALRLEGDFRLAAVGVAPMMYEEEDFLFRRGWWLQADWNPETWLLDMRSPEQPKPM
ncbi:MAG: hypothetical protein AB1696_26680 [Planctomycetota bacterium]